MPLSPTHDTPFIIPGPAGNLEAILTRADTASAPNIPNIIGIICHPHPLHGGTMGNKVVTTLSRSLRKLGIDNIRFNFRGIGKSQGSYGEGIGETEDLAAVMQWTVDNFPGCKIWLLGFSFGAYISANLAHHISAKTDTFTTLPKPSLLVSVAPAVNRSDFTPFSNIECPWIVIKADKDEIVPAQDIDDWAKELQKSISLETITECTHFFHGQLGTLRERLKGQLEGHISQ